MERMMNEINEWKHVVKRDVVEGPVESVSRDEVVLACNEMKAGKSAASREVVWLGDIREFQMHWECQENEP